MTKEKDFSLPMFTEAYEQFGQKLEEGEIMVVEGGFLQQGWRDQNDGPFRITQ